MLKVVVVVAAVLVPLLVSHFTGGWVAVYTSKGFSVDKIPSLEGQVAIVTGANTGIGKITVRDLAKKGARVVLASRSIDKGEAARQEICDEIGSKPCDVTVLALDLASLNSVLEFSNEITLRFNRIDMLILNAGIMFTPFGTTADGYERQWGTNHLGHFFLVERLLPMLTASKSRVVCVSSTSHKFPYSGGIAFDQLDSDKNYNAVKAYGQSKLANVLFSNELSKRYSATGLTSNSLHPGVIKTELMRHTNSGISSILPKALADVVFAIEDAVFNMMFMTPDQGALTQLYVATSPDLAGVTGKYFEPVGVEATTTTYGQDAELQRRLWEVSADFTAKFLESKGLTKD